MCHHFQQHFVQSAVVAPLVVIGRGSSDRTLRAKGGAEGSWWQPSVLLQHGAHTSLTQTNLVDEISQKPTDDLRTMRKQQAAGAPAEQEAEPSMQPSSAHPIFALSNWTNQTSCSSAPSDNSSSIWCHSSHALKVS